MTIGCFFARQSRLFLARDLRKEVLLSSASTRSASTLLFSDAVVHKRGDLPYGTREYLLLPPHVSLQNVQDSYIIASMRAHRNIMFGARVSMKKPQERDEEDWSIATICPPLLQAALDDCSAQGDQVQAMSTLYGLSDWVVACLNDDSSQSKVLKDLDDPVVLEAVRAIATGTPRPGHSVVGQGTFRDGEVAWTALAGEYAELGLSDEARLYQQHSARLVNIEHLADMQPGYLKSAGGAMARFVFLI
jgi:hypothetical protein